MEFLIKRASDWSVKPCDEAVSYIVKSVTELDQDFDNYREWSYTDDEQAGEQNELFTRWKVSFGTIEELTGFVQKHNKLVIASITGAVPNGIIIYDDYIE